MALTDLSTFKSFLGITGTAQDTLLTLILAGADSAVKTYLGRDIEQTTYPGAAAYGVGDSGYYSGDNARFLRLRQYPVQSVTSIYLDWDGHFGTGTDPFDSTTLLAAGTDYRLHLDGCLPGSSTKVGYSGLVERINGIWPATSIRRIGELTGREVPQGGNIKVAYVAGYATVPSDLVLACCQIGARIRNTTSKGDMLQSESLGGYSYSLAAQAAIAEIGTIAATLAKYKPVVMG